MNRFPNHRFLPYGLVLPSLTVIVIFLIIPFGQAIYQSFHRVSPFGRELRAVGWRNYVEMFKSPEYLTSFRNTLIFAVLVIGIGLTISLCIALLTTQKIRGAGFYQIAFIWTYAMSPIIAGVMWSLIFDPSIGFMTNIIDRLTGYRINFFTDTVAAFVLVTAASVWVMLGYNICFFVAGLQ
ncbi:MAG: sugar ABC transporter permease, partial [Firmicutes bacterium]|nr:sugar ABC transporter permease [Bacillota bacterium]